MLSPMKNRVVHLVEGGRWILAKKVGGTWYSNIHSRAPHAGPVVTSRSLIGLVELGIATYASSQGAARRYRMLSCPELSVAGPWPPSEKGGAGLKLREELQVLRETVAKQGALVGQLVEWSRPRDYGKDLCPGVGVRDTYGEGVRAMKAVVLRMIWDAGEEQSTGGLKDVEDEVGGRDH